MALTVNITGGMDLDQGSQVNLSATVTENGNPPLGTVVYAWSADRGSFVGATDQAAATYEADFSDASDVDVTITCAVTRAAESNPTITSLSLSSMAQLGITGIIANMYVSDVSDHVDGSNYRNFYNESGEGTLDGNSDVELATGLNVGTLKWRASTDHFGIDRTSASTAAVDAFFDANTSLSAYLLFDDFTYWELPNSARDGDGTTWQRWEITDATFNVKLDNMATDAAFLFGVADGGSIGWAADSGSGTAMFTARHVGGSDRRILSQTTLPPARRDDALIPVAIQDPNDPTNVLTYRFTKDDLITFVTAGIEALTADERLDYNSLKNTPTIPPPFEVDDITATAAIADNDKLVFSDQSATDQPNTYTTFETFKNLVRESIQDEGVVIDSHPDFLNFAGTGVTVTDSGDGVVITIPGGSAFDLHDGVSTQLTSLASADRMLVSDESTVDEPNRYITIETLTNYILDLHNRIGTQLTGIASNDRIPITDESAADDPVRFVTVQTLSNHALDLHDRITTELTSIANADRIAITDESAAGDPTRWTSADTFADYVLTTLRLLATMQLFTDAQEEDAREALNIRIEEDWNPTPITPNTFVTISNLKLVRIGNLVNLAGVAANTAGTVSTEEFNLPTGFTIPNSSEIVNVNDNVQIVRGGADSRISIRPQSSGTFHFLSLWKI